MHEVYFLVGHITDNGRFLNPLSQEEERTLFIRFYQGDLEAKNELISRNLRLVACVAKKYISHSASIDDLISIGTVGLIKAIEKFDYNIGAKFSSFAGRCIDNEILMYLRANKKTSTELYLQEPIEIDSEGNEICLMDILGSDDDSMHEEMENRLLIKKIYRLIESVLDEREKTVILLRFGLCCEPKTQREVAEFLGLSRSYVSRIEQKAIKKLKKAIDNT